MKSERDHVGWGNRLLPLLVELSKGGREIGKEVVGPSFPGKIKTAKEKWGDSFNLFLDTYYKSKFEFKKRF